MTRKLYLFAVPNLTCMLLLWSPATAWAQEASTRSPYRPASARNVTPDVADDAPTQSSETSVAAALKMGESMLQRLETVEDYECVFTKRERIAGKLGDHQQMLARVRHQPFSVYLKFVAPDEVADREVVWVDGQNQGKLLVKGVGWQAALGTIALNPESTLAMQGNLHPISDIGMRNLANKVVAGAQDNADYDDVKVRYLRPAKVADRTCTCLQFDSDKRRKGARYRRWRIFLDDNLSLPIRFEGYSWPEEGSDDPLLLEEYTYTGLKLNNGFTDRDFSL